jgi:hypothetical protein
VTMQPKTREFLKFLNANSEIRTRIRAPRDGTVLYTGAFFIRPAYKEISEMRKLHPHLATKKMLHEVLASIQLVGQPYPNLLEWIESLKPLEPWNRNGLVAWRAVSGLFASNASGRVSFVVGDGVDKQSKVFAMTEVHILARNPNVDDLTKDLLAYYKRCIDRGEPDIGVAFWGA